MRLIAAAVAAALLLELGGGTALAAPAATAAAAYVATVPATLGAGAAAPIIVALTNTGDEAWVNGGPSPVNLSYHWYDASGAAAVWDGARTPLPGAILPGGTASVVATVIAPAKAGAYLLRFALVREGVGWFPPSAAFPVAVAAAFQASFMPATVPSFLAGGTSPVALTLTNTGLAAWNAGGANPVRLSYHWHDAAGNTVVWDGARTALAADVAPGASATVTAAVVAPDAAGIYRLSFDLVREGVGWFASLGATTPLRLDLTVQAAVYRVTYAAVGSVSALLGEQKTVAITVVNAGNVAWSASGSNLVNAAYHLFDAAGNTVVWDGTRTPLGGDLAAGASRTVNVAYTAPSAIGTYTLAIDLVREGFAWFSGLGSPALRFPLVVTSGFSVGYGATTTPSLATIGSTLQLSVDVVNYGPRALSPTGANPVNLGYHILTSSGAVAVWDGNRGALPSTTGATEVVNVKINVVVPQTLGDYRIVWDLVQEGVAWFSQLGVQTKIEPISVQPGVTFYGKGFGHAVGLSQWGAQGWATGASGPALVAEQIVAKYYQGTITAALPPPGGGIRVLLSAPSSQGRFTCGAAYFAGSLANAMSNGGFKVLNEGAANALIDTAGPTVTFQLLATGGLVQVWNQASLRKVYEGAGPVTLVPLDATKPIRIQEKGWYRGNVRFTNLGNTLRTVNYVSYDDYARGVIPLEMPQSWHLEAYKAQAYAARSYAYTSYRGGASDYDVSDDQSDQCYGGVQLADSVGGKPVENDVTNAAVNATLGKVIAYGGAAIRAYFSSSSGGYTLPFGCWGATKTTCADSPPYLSAVPDPADVAVSVPTANKQAGWTATYTSAQIRAILIAWRGVDIGTLLSVDISNEAPYVLGHVVSIRFGGTNATVEVPADGFLRGQLGLKSTMVRLNPF